MRHRWIRNEPDATENKRAAMMALGAAAGVAAVVFYFARIFLAREEIRPLDEVRGRTALPGGDGERSRSRTALPARGEVDRATP